MSFMGLGCLIRSIAVKPVYLIRLRWSPGPSALNPHLMRKTIVINTLLILGYYLILQLLIWAAMVLR